MAFDKVILVTGSSGFIGSDVVKRFSQAGYTVVGLDHNPPTYAYDHFEFFKVDVTSEQSLEWNLNKIKEKYGDTLYTVIHLASFSFSDKHSQAFEENLYKGTQEIIKGIKKFAEVGQFIFLSTQRIFSPGENIDEDSPTNPKWEYPEANLKTEKLIQDELAATFINSSQGAAERDKARSKSIGPHDESIAEGAMDEEEDRSGKAAAGSTPDEFMKVAKTSIPYIIFRSANCYNEKCHSRLLSNQILRIYERRYESRFFPGNINHGRPYLHLDDLVDAVWGALQMRDHLPPHLIINIAEEKTFTYEQIQNEIWLLIYGRTRSTHSVPKWLAKIATYFQFFSENSNAEVESWMIDIADDNYTINISKAKKLLGWEPKNTLMQTLPKIIDYLKSDPKSFYSENNFELPKWLIELKTDVH